MLFNALFISSKANASMTETRYLRSPERLARPANPEEMSAQTRREEGRIGVEQENTKRKSLTQSSPKTMLNPP